MSAIGAVRRGRRRASGENGSFWLSFSDMMSVLVLIFIFVIFAMLHTLNEHEKQLEVTRAEYEAAKIRFDATQAENEQLVIILGNTENALASAQAELDEAKTPLTYAVPLEKMPFTKDFYVAGRELWEKATEAVKDDAEVVRKHVAWGRFGLEYALAGGYAQLGDWRAVLLSSNAVARLDRAEFMRMRESARYCQRMLAADSNAILSSRLNDVRYRGYLKAFAESEFPETAPQKALLQDWAFNYNDHPKSKTMSREDDKEATDSRAIMVKGEKESWSVSCPLVPVLALDRGVTYRMRARIKAEPKADAKPETRLLNMGMFDRVSRKTPCILSLRNSQATGKYEWYDMGEWTDEGHDCLMYMSPYGSNFSFDCVEISVVR